MNIAALVSGGVDSSVMLYLLKEQGINPTMFYIQIGMKEDEHFIDCSSEEDIEIATALAKKYGLKLEIVPLHNEYWDNVIEYTINSVKKGLTPNPDVMCNRLIKFGEFEKHWGKDFDLIATGHYAGTENKMQKKYLTTAKDKLKDQTDFLAQITYNQLLKLTFPLADYMKSEVRDIALEQNMPSAMRKDSQGICFLGKVNYNDFIKKYLGTKTGNIVELSTGKILGTHNGFWFHTIGQRKGLNLGGGPWFVIKKDVEQNIIYVDNGYDPPSQYTDTVLLENMHFITENPFGEEDNINITFKIRHTPDFTKGVLLKTSDKYIIKSEEPLSGVAAGQFGVIYDTNSHICMGSGIIDNN